MDVTELVVYDIEILRCIPDRGAPRDPELLYCAGWGDHANMGIAVLAAIDMRDRRPRLFLQDNLGEFAKLIDGRTVCGYNNQGFDDRLLAANGIRVTRSVDLMCAIRRAAGHPEQGPLRGYKLDDVVQVNLGVQKPMSGAMAPVAWQRGQRGLVIDYCLFDTSQTAELVARCPTLIDPVTRRPLDVQLA
jgi:hypothetical protein